MISNPEGYISTNRTPSELGLQLLYAAERGRAHEVKRLLAAGASLYRDAVS